MTDWAAIVAREEARYQDGLERLAVALPVDADVRQKQLVRVANAALGAGLAELMAGHGQEARGWLLRAAERYRESYDGAPPGSYGRLIGAVKARLLAEDEAGARADARWAVDEDAAAAESPIGRYAAVLALLVLGDDQQAADLAGGLRTEPPDRFPPAVADALAGLALGDRPLYEVGLAETLRSFETREAYLEDVPVADTVLVLDLLAGRRGMAVQPASALLP